MAHADVDSVETNSRLSNEHFSIVVVVKSSCERRERLFWLDLERRNEGEGADLSVNVDEGKGWESVESMEDG